MHMDIKETGSHIQEDQERRLKKVKAVLVRRSQSSFASSRFNRNILV